MKACFNTINHSIYIFNVFYDSQRAPLYILACQEVNIRVGLLYYRRNAEETVNYYENANMQ